MRSPNEIASSSKGAGSQMMSLRNGRRSDDRSGRCFTSGSIGFLMWRPDAVVIGWSRVGMPWLRPMTRAFIATPIVMRPMPRIPMFTKQNARISTYENMMRPKPSES